jgi:hypothetical protein
MSPLRASRIGFGRVTADEHIPLRGSRRLTRREVAPHLKLCWMTEGHQTRHSRKKSPYDTMN